MLERADYDRFRVSPVDPATIRVAHVEHALAQLEPTSGGRLRVEKFAESFEGRPIYLATLGSGPKCVLLWSQMHGDEPTHTAVLLDLLSYLVRKPAEPFAEKIRDACTLHMIPLLNPDGAERFSRFNAQDIDVNRDARRLATPEGRALRKAVETLKPEFAFNLHNQNARTAVGKPPRFAVASLLAPPPDEQRTETEAVRCAKQIAACFVSATRPDVDQAGGMLSKYDDTFEPRAFGDWVQSTGAATVLVEAGGWPTADSEPLVRLHFHGMLSSLHAIASESYRDIDRLTYESLSFSNSSNLVDCLITSGQVICVAREPKSKLAADIGVVRNTRFIADIAINYAQGHRLAQPEWRDGKITDVGDLSVLGAKQTVDAANCFVLPGRIALLQDWDLSNPLEEEQLDRLLSAGVTTVLGVVPTNDDGIKSRESVKEMPLNWGFVTRRDSTRSSTNDPPSGAHESTQNLNPPITFDILEALSTPASDAKNYAQLQAEISLAYAWFFGFDTNRGKISRDSVADLQLLEVDGQTNQWSKVKWDRLNRVLVAGVTVWENGKRTGSNPGVFLRGK